VRESSSSPDAAGQELAEGLASRSSRLLKNSVVLTRECCPWEVAFRELQCHAHHTQAVFGFRVQAIFRGSFRANWVQPTED